MKRRTILVLMIAGGMLASHVLAQPRRQAVGQDHPLLERVPGSVIVRYNTEEFDSLVVPLGKSTGIDKFSESTRVEGKITRITYEMPKGRSTTEVFRSYRDALAAAGFEILYRCEMEDCGNVLHFQKLERPFIIRGEHRYVAAKGSASGGDVYVTVRVYQTARKDPPVRAMVHVAELGRMAADLVQVNADAMKSEIAKQGRVALYGIYFDTDKAEVKPASQGTLEEMAKFLAGNPTMRVYIVGHTDNVGGLDYNMDLSRRRAEAVAKALTSRHGAAPDRLIGRGVGPLSPVATNETEQGRSKNRRVELVAQ